MKTKATKKSLFHEIEARYQAEVKRLKRKKFMLKAKLVLTVILPVFILLLSVKVIKTFVRLKIRDLFAKPQVKKSEPSVPVPLEKIPVKKEAIQPVPQI